LPESKFADFIPISPMMYGDKVQIDDDTFVSISSLSNNKEKLLKLLSNQSVTITLLKTDNQGNVSYGPLAISVDVGTYKMIMDYSKYATLKIYDETGNCSGFGKVGVGLRITANIKTNKSGINFGTLLGLATNSQYLSGSLNIDVIGIEGSDVTSLTTIPTDINISSIQGALETMATIKSKIYETNTRLNPQIIAVKKTSGECSIMEMLGNKIISK